MSNKSETLINIIEDSEDEFKVNVRSSEYITERIFVRLHKIYECVEKVKNDNKTLTGSDIETIRNEISGLNKILDLIFDLHERSENLYFHLEGKAESSQSSL